MNYQKLYDTFIEARRYRVLSDEQRAISEDHHIVPVWLQPKGFKRGCLADKADTANHILLTYREHLFAHLLLAKVHGPKGWSAVLLMLEKRKREKSPGFWHNGGKRYEALRKSSIAGRTHSTIHHFVHKDGRKVTCTRYVLRTKYNINDTLMWRLLSGKGVTAEGWRLKNGREKLLNGHKRKLMEKQEREGYGDIVHEFVHENGTELTLTHAEMQRKFGFIDARLKRVIDGNAYSIHGWSMKHPKPRKMKLAERRVIERHDREVALGNRPAKFEFVHTDGRSEVCVPHDMVTNHGFDCFRLEQLLAGGSVSLQGWSIKGGRGRKMQPQMLMSMHQKTAAAILNGLASPLPNAVAEC